MQNATPKPRPDDDFPEVWSVVDWTEKKCTIEQIGKPVDQAHVSKAFWSTADVVARRCLPQQVGQPKATADDVEALLLAASAADLNTEQFKRDVLIAYKALGGPRYLMGKPLLMEKLLVKLLGEQKAPTGPATVTVNLSWLSPERLAYRNSGPVVDVAPVLAGDQLLRAELGPQEGT